MDINRKVGLFIVCEFNVVMGTTVSSIEEEKTSVYFNVQVLQHHCNKFTELYYS
jgi:hypothetical protein